MKVVIAGGSGALGRKVTKDLVDSGHDVVVLTRSPGSVRYGLQCREASLREVRWDGETLGDWARELEPTPHGTAVINLAGKLVDCRPTVRNIAALRDSRVNATRVLVEASRSASAPVARWVQASTTAIWSDAGEERVTESTPIPADGLPQMTGVAQPWEEAVQDAHTEYLSILRTSIVLGADFPAMDRLFFLAKLGLGGKVAHGRQWVSWIHLDDWLAIVRAGLGIEPGVDLPAGVVIGAAPEPVRNAELMSTIRRASGMPVGLPTPSPVLRLGAIMLRTDPALGLTGRHCTSEVLAETGFTFDYPTVGQAVGTTS
ncbi:epimerase [Nesterenkonia haasae]|uniref:epimerase n=1 Tax=Nesterenkonia haasae TaxID=2587813 RepID=UPI0013917203|nr:DUF1731 domain-containing protein [Nesterenkonia haasae]NDK32799.1 DUF1731 domain-containing protein [Nesterenkonia haasae]